MNPPQIANAKARKIFLEVVFWNIVQCFMELRFKFINNFVLNGLCPFW
jgi:hypothetical protein